MANTCDNPAQAMDTLGNICPPAPIVSPSPEPFFSEICVSGNSSGLSGVINGTYQWGYTVNYDVVKYRNEFPLYRKVILEGGASTVNTIHYSEVYMNDDGLWEITTFWHGRATYVWIEATNPFRGDLKTATPDLVQNWKAKNSAGKTVYVNQGVCPSAEPEPSPDPCPEFICVSGITLVEPNMGRSRPEDTPRDGEYEHPAEGINGTYRLNSGSHFHKFVGKIVYDKEVAIKTSRILNSGTSYAFNYDTAWATIYWDSTGTTPKWSFKILNSRASPTQDFSEREHIYKNFSTLACPHSIEAEWEDLSPRYKDNPVITYGECSPAPSPEPVCICVSNIGYLDGYKNPNGLYKESGVKNGKKKFTHIDNDNFEIYYDKLEPEPFKWIIDNSDSEDLTGIVAQAPNIIGESPEEILTWRPRGEYSEIGDRVNHTNIKVERCDCPKPSVSPSPSPSASPPPPEPPCPETPCEDKKYCCYGECVEFHECLLVSGFVFTRLGQKNPNGYYKISHTVEGDEFHGERPKYVNSNDSDFSLEWDGGDSDRWKLVRDGTTIAHATDNTCDPDSVLAWFLYPNVGYAATSVPQIDADDCRELERTVCVFGLKSWNGSTIDTTINGTYEEAEPHAGKPTYLKDPEDDDASPLIIWTGNFWKIVKKTSPAYVVAYSRQNVEFPGQVSSWVVNPALVSGQIYSNEIYVVDGDCPCLDCDGDDENELWPIIPIPVEPSPEPTDPSASPDTLTSPCPSSQPNLCVCGPTIYGDGGLDDNPIEAKGSSGVYRYEPIGFDILGGAEDGWTRTAEGNTYQIYWQAGSGESDPASWIFRVNGAVKFQRRYPGQSLPPKCTPDGVTGWVSLNSTVAEWSNQSIKFTRDSDGDGCTACPEILCVSGIYTSSPENKVSEANGLYHEDDFINGYPSYGSEPLDSGQYRIIYEGAWYIVFEKNNYNAPIDTSDTIWDSGDYVIIAEGENENRPQDVTEWDAVSPYFGDAINASFRYGESTCPSTSPIIPSPTPTSPSPSPIVSPPPCPYFLCVSGITDTYEVALTSVEDDLIGYDAAYGIRREANGQYYYTRDTSFGSIYGSPDSKPPTVYNGHQVYLRRKDSGNNTGYLYCFIKEPDGWYLAEWRNDTYYVKTSGGEYILKEKGFDFVKVLVGIDSEDISCPQDVPEWGNMSGTPYSWNQEYPDRIQVEGSNAYTDCLHVAPIPSLGPSVPPCICVSSYKNEPDANGTYCVLYDDPLHNGRPKYIHRDNGQFRIAWDNQTNILRLCIDGIQQSISQADIPYLNVLDDGTPPKYTTPEKIRENIFNDIDRVTPASPNGLYIAKQTFLVFNDNGKEVEVPTLDFHNGKPQYVKQNAEKLRTVAIGTTREKRVPFLWDYRILWSGSRWEIWAEHIRVITDGDFGLIAFDVFGADDPDSPGIIWSLADTEHFGGEVVSGGDLCNGWQLQRNYVPFEVMGTPDYNEIYKKPERVDPQVQADAFPTPPCKATGEGDIAEGDPLPWENWESMGDYFYVSCDKACEDIEGGPYDPDPTPSARPNCICVNSIDGDGEQHSAPWTGTYCLSGTQVNGYDRYEHESYPQESETNTAKKKKYAIEVGEIEASNTLVPEGNPPKAVFVTGVENEGGKFGQEEVNAAPGYGLNGWYYPSEPQGSKVIEYQKLDSQGEPIAAVSWHTKKKIWIIRHYKFSEHRKTGIQIIYLTDNEDPTSQPPIPNYDGYYKAPALGGGIDPRRKWFFTGHYTGSVRVHYWNEGEITPPLDIPSMLMWKLLNEESDPVETFAHVIPNSLDDSPEEFPEDEKSWTAQSLYYPPVLFSGECQSLPSPSIPPDSDDDGPVPSILPADPSPSPSAPTCNIRICVSGIINSEGLISEANGLYDCTGVFDSMLVEGKAVKSPRFKHTSRNYYVQSTLLKGSTADSFYWKLFDGSGSTVARGLSKIVGKTNGKLIVLPDVVPRESSLKEMVEGNYSNGYDYDNNDKRTVLYPWYTKWYAFNSSNVVVSYRNLYNCIATHPYHPSPSPFPDSLCLEGLYSNIDEDATERMKKTNPQGTYYYNNEHDGMPSWKNSSEWKIFWEHDVHAWVLTRRIDYLHDDIVMYSENSDDTDHRKFPTEIDDWVLANFDEYYFLDYFDDDSSSFVVIQPKFKSGVCPPSPEPLPIPSCSPEPDFCISGITGSYSFINGEYKLNGYDSIRSNSISVPKYYNSFNDSVVVRFIDGQNRWVVQNKDSYSYYSQEAFDSGLGNPLGYIDGKWYFGFEKDNSICPKNISETDLSQIKYYIYENIPDSVGSFDGMSLIVCPSPSPATCDTLCVQGTRYIPLDNLNGKTPTEYGGLPISGSRNWRAVLNGTYNRTQVGDDENWVKIGDPEKRRVDVKIVYAPNWRGSGPHWVFKVNSGPPYYNNASVLAARASYAREAGPWMIEKWKWHHVLTDLNQEEYYAPDCDWVKAYMISEDDDLEAVWFPLFQNRQDAYNYGDQRDPTPHTFKINPNDVNNSADGTPTKLWMPQAGGSNNVVRYLGNFTDGAGSRFIDPPSGEAEKYRIVQVCEPAPPKALPEFTPCVSCPPTDEDDEWSTPPIPEPSGKPCAYLCVSGVDDESLNEAIAHPQSGNDIGEWKIVTNGIYRRTGLSTCQGTRNVWIKDADGDNKISETRIYFVQEEIVGRSSHKWVIAHTMSGRNKTNKFSIVEGFYEGGSSYEATCNKCPTDDANLILCDNPGMEGFGKIVWRQVYGTSPVDFSDFSIVCIEENEQEDCRNRISPPPSVPPSPSAVPSPSASVPPVDVPVDPSASPGPLPSVAPSIPPVCLVSRGDFECHDEEALEYLLAIAFGDDEQSNSLDKITKWIGAVKIMPHWLNNAGFDESGSIPEIVSSDIATLEGIIDELNSLTDNVFFSLRSASSSWNINDADIHIFFTTTSRYAIINPDMANSPCDIQGTNYPVCPASFISYYNNNGKIYQASVLVERSFSGNTRKHLIREELTQSLGLPKDSLKYPDSMFYDNWTTTTSYSDIDKKIISMLYYPPVGPGMTRNEVIRIFTILCDSPAGPFYYDRHINGKPSYTREDYRLYWEVDSSVSYSRFDEPVWLVVRENQDPPKKVISSGYRSSWESPRNDATPDLVPRDNWGSIDNITNSYVISGNCTSPSPEPITPPQPAYLTGPSPDPCFTSENGLCLTFQVKKNQVDVEACLDGAPNSSPRPYPYEVESPSASPDTICATTLFDIYHHKGQNSGELINQSPFQNMDEVLSEVNKSREGDSSRFFEEKLALKVEVGKTPAGILSIKVLEEKDVRFGSQKVFTVFNTEKNVIEIDVFPVSGANVIGWALPSRLSEQGDWEIDFIGVPVQDMMVTPPEGWKKDYQYDNSNSLGKSGGTRLRLTYVGDCDSYGTATSDPEPCSEVKLNFACIDVPEKYVANSPYQGYEFKTPQEKYQDFNQLEKSFTSNYENEINIISQWEWEKEFDDGLCTVWNPPEYWEKDVDSEKVFFDSSEDIPPHNGYNQFIGHVVAQRWAGDTQIIGRPGWVGFQTWLGSLFVGETRVLEEEKINTLDNFYKIVDSTRFDTLLAQWRTVYDNSHLKMPGTNVWDFLEVDNSITPILDYVLNSTFYYSLDIGLNMIDLRITNSGIHVGDTEAVIAYKTGDYTKRLPYNIDESDGPLASFSDETLDLWFEFPEIAEWPDYQPDTEALKTKPGRIERRQTFKCNDCIKTINKGTIPYGHELPNILKQKLGKNKNPDNRIYWIELEFTGLLSKKLLSVHGTQAAPGWYFEMTQAPEESGVTSLGHAQNRIGTNTRYKFYYTGTNSPATDVEIVGNAMTLAYDHYGVHVTEKCPERPISTELIDKNTVDVTISYGNLSSANLNFLGPVIPFKDKIFGYGQINSDWKIEVIGLPKSLLTSPGSIEELDGASKFRVQYTGVKECDRSINNYNLDGIDPTLASPHNNQSHSHGLSANYNGGELLASTTFELGDLGASPTNSRFDDIDDFYNKISKTRNSLQRKITEKHIKIEGESSIYKSLSEIHYDDPYITEYENGDKLNVRWNGIEVGLDKTGIVLIKAPEGVRAKKPEGTSLVLDLIFSGQFDRKIAYIASSISDKDWKITNLCLPTSVVKNNFNKKIGDICKDGDKSVWRIEYVGKIKVGPLPYAFKRPWEDSESSIDNNYDVNNSVWKIDTSQADGLGANTIWNIEYAGPLTHGILYNSGEFRYGYPKINVFSDNFSLGNKDLSKYVFDFERGISRKPINDLLEKNSILNWPGWNVSKTKTHSQSDFIIDLFASKEPHVMKGYKEYWRNFAQSSTLMQIRGGLSRKESTQSEAKNPLTDTIYKINFGFYSIQKYDESQWPPVTDEKGHACAKDIDISWSLNQDWTSGGGYLIFDKAPVSMKTVYYPGVPVQTISFEGQYAETDVIPRLEKLMKVGQSHVINASEVISESALKDNKEWIYKITRTAINKFDIRINDKFLTSTFTTKKVYEQDKRNLWFENQPKNTTIRQRHDWGMLVEFVGDLSGHSIVPTGNDMIQVLPSHYILGITKDSPFTSYILNDSLLSVTVLQKGFGDSSRIYESKVFPFPNTKNASDAFKPPVITIQGGNIKSEYSGVPKVSVDYDPINQAKNFEVYMPTHPGQREKEWDGNIETRGRFVSQQEGGIMTKSLGYGVTEIEFSGRYGGTDWYPYQKVRSWSYSSDIITPEYTVEPMKRLSSTKWQDDNGIIYSLVNRGNTKTSDKFTNSGWVDDTNPPEGPLPGGPYGHGGRNTGCEGSEDFTCFVAHLDILWVLPNGDVSSLMITQNALDVRVSSQKGIHIFNEDTMPAGVTIHSKPGPLEIVLNVSGLYMNRLITFTKNRSLEYSVLTNPYNVRKHNDRDASTLISIRYIGPECGVLNSDLRYDEVLGENSERYEGIVTRAEDGLIQGPAGEQNGEWGIFNRPRDTLANKNNRNIYFGINASENPAIGTATIEAGDWYDVQFSINPNNKTISYKQKKEGELHWSTNKTLEYHGEAVRNTTHKLRIGHGLGSSGPENWDIKNVKIYDTPCPDNYTELSEGNKNTKWKVSYIGPTPNPALTSENIVDLKGFCECGLVGSLKAKYDDTRFADGRLIDFQYEDPHTAGDGCLITPIGFEDLSQTFEWGGVCSSCMVHPKFGSDFFPEEAELDLFVFDGQLNSMSEVELLAANDEDVLLNRTIYRGGISLRTEEAVGVDAQSVSIKVVDGITGSSLLSAPIDNPIRISFPGESFNGKIVHAISNNPNFQVKTISVPTQNIDYTPNISSSAYTIIEVKYMQIAVDASISSNNWKVEVLQWGEACLPSSTATKKMPDPCFDYTMDGSEEEHPYHPSPNPGGNVGGGGGLDTQVPVPDDESPPQEPGLCYEEQRNVNQMVGLKENSSEGKPVYDSFIQTLSQLKIGVDRVTGIHLIEPPEGIHVKERDGCNIVVVFRGAVYSGHLIRTPDVNASQIKSELLCCSRNHWLYNTGGDAIGFTGHACFNTVIKYTYVGNDCPNCDDMEGVAPPVPSPTPEFPTPIDDEGGIFPDFDPTPPIQTEPIPVPPVEVDPSVPPSPTPSVSPLPPPIFLPPPPSPTPGITVSPSPSTIIPPAPYKEIDSIHMCCDCEDGWVVVDGENHKVTSNSGETSGGEASDGICETGPYGPMHYNAITVFVDAQVWYVMIYKDWTYCNSHTDASYAELVNSGIRTFTGLELGGTRCNPTGNTPGETSGATGLSEEEEIIERHVYFEGLFYNGHLVNVKNLPGPGAMQNINTFLAGGIVPPVQPDLFMGGPEGFPQQYMFNCGGCNIVSNVMGSYGKCDSPTDTKTTTPFGCDSKSLGDMLGYGVNCFKARGETHEIPTRRVACGGKVKLAFCRGPCDYWWAPEGGANLGGSNLNSGNSDGSYGRRLGGPVARVGLPLDCPITDSQGTWTKIGSLHMGKTVSKPWQFSTYGYRYTDIPYGKYDVTAYHDGVREGDDHPIIKYEKEKGLRDLSDNSRPDCRPCWYEMGSHCYNPCWIGTTGGPDSALGVDGVYEGEFTLDGAHESSIDGVPQGSWLNSGCSPSNTIKPNKYNDPNTKLFTYWPLLGHYKNSCVNPNIGRCIEEMETKYFDDPAFMAASSLWMSYNVGNDWISGGCCECIGPPLGAGATVTY